MPDPDSQVCCHCHNGEKINRKRYLFSIQKILFCMRIWLDWLCQPICLAEGKMDPLLSWSGKIQFNPFVLINCSSGHHSSVLHSPHILSWIHHSHVHIQGLWGAKREREGRGLSFQFVAGVASAGQAGAALIRASLEIRDTVRWSHSTFHRSQ